MKMITGDMTPSQKRRFFLLILMFFMFAGVVSGTLIFISNPENERFRTAWLSQYLTGIAVMTPFKVFACSLIPVVLMLVFQLLCGLFAFGQPFCVSTLVMRGIAGGIASASIYAQYGYKGFFLILIMLVPMLIFNMYILSLGARESIRLSNMTAGFIFGKNNDGVCEIRLYLIKFLVLAGFALASAVIESALIYFFADFFNP